MQQLSPLLSRLIKANVIQYGKFKLKSGLATNIYVDFRKALNDSTLLAQLSYELAKLIDTKNIQNVQDIKDTKDKNHTTEREFCIAGVPLGALPCATMVSYILNKPLIIARPQSKTHGNVNQNDQKGENESKEAKQIKNVILIEDVITTGSSVLEIINRLTSEGYRVVQVLALLDRRDSSNSLSPPSSSHSHNQPMSSIPIRALFTMNQLLDSQLESILKRSRTRTINCNSHTQSLLDARQRSGSHLIIALDSTCPMTILKWVQELSTTSTCACAFKLHLDIISFSSPTEEYNFFKTLSHWKRRYGFLIIEDRKFADIGAISHLQLLRIINLTKTFHEKFVDLITCHGVPGGDSLLALDKLATNLDIGLLPVYQMSSKGNLIDALYSIRFFDIICQCKNVAGLIAQEPVEGYLTLCPGVSLDVSVNNQNNSNHDKQKTEIKKDKKEDGQGQTYRDARHIQADFLIVGRSITDSPHPNITARKLLALSIIKSKL